MKHILAGLALLTLTACSSGEQGAFGAAFQQIRGSLFNRGADETAQFTATRASLRAAGIERPVLVVRAPDVDISVGLLEYEQTGGVTIWRSLDGNTVSTASGLLRNTRGFGTDLHSLDTAPAESALASGNDAEYSRVFRAVDGEGVLHRARLYCRLTQEGREQVDVLGQGYDSVRFRETCRADGVPNPIFENLYWRGVHGQIWKSRQWAGPDLGYMTLERVTLQQ